MYKTTKKDFAIFKAEAKKWIKYFGLTEWEYYWEHSDIDSTARCQFNCSEMTALIILATEMDVKQDFKLSAFHEVCELLLAPMTDLVLEQYSIAKSCSVTHNIIHRLENSIFYK